MPHNQIEKEKNNTWLLHFQPISGSIYNNGNTYVVLSGSKDPSKSSPSINSFNSQNWGKNCYCIAPPHTFFFPDEEMEAQKG